MYPFNTSHTHESWASLLQHACAELDPDYLESLSNSDWLPGPDKIFNAFSLPLPKVRCILFGESPYPRKESANGYCFWDARVGSIWSEKGLSTEVNRATSLRNIVKMLLVAEKALSPLNTSQDAIAKLDKSAYVNTLSELFENLQGHGILLLNASLVLSNDKVQKDAKAWQPFMAKLLQEMTLENHSIKLILLGKVAHDIDKIYPAHQEQKFYAEHPYNISFINNQNVINLFGPMHLLRKESPE